MTQCGTPLYMSPEQCRGQPYSRAADVWALGVVLWEMLTLQAPYMDKLKPHQRGIHGLLRAIQSTRLDILCIRKRYSDEMTALTAALLAQDVARRPTMSAVLHWPVLRNASGIDFTPTAAAAASASPEPPTEAEDNRAAWAIQRSFRRMGRPRVRGEPYPYAQVKAVANARPAARPWPLGPAPPLPHGSPVEELAPPKPPPPLPHGLPVEKLAPPKPPPPPPPPAIPPPWLRPGVEQRLHAVRDQLVAQRAGQPQEPGPATRYAIAKAQVDDLKQAREAARMHAAYGGGGPVGPPRAVAPPQKNAPTSRYDGRYAKPVRYSNIAENTPAPQQQYRVTPIRPQPIPSAVLASPDAEIGWYGWYPVEQKDGALPLQPQASPPEHANRVNAAANGAVMDKNGYLFYPMSADQGLPQYKAAPRPSRAAPPAAPDEARPVVPSDAREEAALQLQLHRQRIAVRLQNQKRV